MLRPEIHKLAPDKVLILSDSNVSSLYADRLGSLSREFDAQLIVIPAGEESKNIQRLSEILVRLSDAKATRNSLLVCVGGGMITDIGGFAAAIFKRGIRHINLATTVLGAVDAAVGGKTGIDFNGYKNEVGAFHLPVATLFDVDAFATLPPSELLSGFGEIAKTALLAGREMTCRTLSVDPLDAGKENLKELCAFCRDFKMKVVDEDPQEKGLRKILNLGHTAGHAFESLLIERGTPVPHGVAVAHGNLVSLVLSHIVFGLDSKTITRYSGWLKEYYPRLPIGCKDYGRLWDISLHDKKNISSTSLSFTLLRPANDVDWTPVYNIGISRTQFEEALDLYREM